MDGPGALLALTLGAGSVSAADRPAPLPVPAGAVDVVRTDRLDAPSVECLVREPYPATGTIDFLMRAMAERGWTLIAADGFAPSPWPEPGGVGPHSVATHTWNARWRNGKGRQAAFWLDYRCPMEASRMHSIWLRVRGGILSATSVRRLESDEKIRRERECTAARAAGRPGDTSCGKKGAP